MANIVENIMTNIEASAVTILGASYQKLLFTSDVSKNDSRHIALGYGVRPLSAASSISITRAYTLDHTFELILTDLVARYISDAEKAIIINIMYDKCDQLFISMVNSKLSLPSSVLSVSSPSIAEPEFLEDQKFVVFRMQFVVKYRSLIS